MFGIFYLERFIFVIYQCYDFTKAPRTRSLTRSLWLVIFYLGEDEKSFFTQWYANGKDVINCWHENPDVDNDHCASCFVKYSQDGNEK